MPKRRTKEKKGFSLIETVIALFVLGIGVMAITQLFASTAKQAQENGRYLTAMGLAQEGVELVRHVRNNNIVQEKELFNGIPITSNGCISGFPPENISIVDCNTINLSRLEVPSGAGVYHAYQHSESTPDNAYPFFWRKIYVEDLIPGKAEKITSVVFFREPSSFPSAANISSECTLVRNCVFVSAVLQ